MDSETWTPERILPTMEIDSAAWRQTVIDGAAELGVTVSGGQARSMGRHAREMVQWNRVSNLTAITDPLAVAVKHYVDALAVTASLDSGQRVLDAGTGGGFPGLPLKIVRSDLSLTLVDSVRKKVSFLKYAIGALGLGGIRAVHGRLEELGRMPAYRGQFDQVVCRAFASLEDFARLCLPFLAPGGCLLAMKGPQAEHDHEIDAITDDGILLLADTRFTIRIHRYSLPVLGDQRRLVRLTPMG
ncbi:16S rRNA (guanine(527)-N(7))-methyltransferase RsmG [Desulfosarcina ovata]|uniref:Ribosomal RNA small subunit methyltransferase G n=1 Tax=Desulfosarcina ovata subsp. ovata TaxID=2752305 RepID=A0A5K8AA94_9BACT|nr:16S rRNA (guanine(527)-N(7))-methyltransferase RsmG [Desulfosarcina ovata]BBO88940.1 ribosomal RNA small subunit methyltransferase G [Desulfosarcina ovata subsp. ovata]